MENAMKHIHRTRGDRIFDAINVAALCLLLAVILYPLIYVLSCSFSDPLLVVQSNRQKLRKKDQQLLAREELFSNLSRNVDDVFLMIDTETSKMELLR